MKTRIILLFTLICTVGQINAQQLQTTPADRSKSKIGATEARPMSSPKLTDAQQMIMRNEVLAQDMQKSLELEQLALNSDRATYADAVKKRKEHNVKYGVKLEQQLLHYKESDPMYAAIKEELARISSDR